MTAANTNSVLEKMPEALQNRLAKINEDLNGDICKFNKQIVDGYRPYLKVRFALDEPEVYSAALTHKRSTSVELMPLLHKCDPSKELIILYEATNTKAKNVGDKVYRIIAAKKLPWADDGKCSVCQKHHGIPFAVKADSKESLETIVRTIMAKIDTNIERTLVHEHAIRAVDELVNIFNDEEVKKMGKIMHMIKDEALSYKEWRIPGSGEEFDHYYRMASINCDNNVMETFCLIAGRSLLACLNKAAGEAAMANEAAQKAAMEKDAAQKATIMNEAAQKAAMATAMNKGPN
jgi:hypothetical protein